MAVVSAHSSLMKRSSQDDHLEGVLGEALGVEVVAGVELLEAGWAWNLEGGLGEALGVEVVAGVELLGGHRGLG